MIFIYNENLIMKCMHILRLIYAYINYLKIKSIDYRSYFYTACNIQD